MNETSRSCSRVALDTAWPRVAQLLRATVPRLSRPLRRQDGPSNNLSHRLAVCLKCWQGIIALTNGQMPCSESSVAVIPPMRAAAAAVDLLADVRTSYFVPPVLTGVVGSTNNGTITSSSSASYRCRVAIDRARRLLTSVTLLCCSSTISKSEISFPFLHSYSLIACSITILLSIHSIIVSYNFSLTHMFKFYYKLYYNVESKYNQTKDDQSYLTRSVHSKCILTVERNHSCRFSLHGTVLDGINSFLSWPDSVRRAASQTIHRGYNPAVHPSALRKTNENL